MYHLEELLTFSQEGFEEFIKNRKFIHAAGGLVQNTNGDFLFMERNGVLDVPKGKIEKGESDEEGALREVEEETGISGLQILSPLIETYHTYIMNGKEVIKRTAWFLMTVQGAPKPTPQLEEGISWVKWMNKEEVTSCIHESYASVIEVWSAANI